MLIDAPTGNVSSVPPWFAKKNGFVKNPHPGALFDLRTDIRQRKNVYADQPDRVEQLQQLLARSRTAGEVRNK